MCKNEHSINVANKLIDAMFGHALRIRSAEIDAVLACEIGTTRFIKDGVVVHLAVIGLKKIVWGGVCLRE